MDIYQKSAIYMVIDRVMECSFPLFWICGQIHGQKPFFSFMVFLIAGTNFRVSNQRLIFYPGKDLVFFGLFGE